MAPHSPFFAKFVKTQSGTKFLLESFHERLAEVTDVVTGVMFALKVPELSSTYFPTENFRAVLPEPKRSYDRPTRGLRSFQVGAWSTRGKSRSATNRPAGR